MKWVAIFLNLLLIMLLIYQLAKKGGPGSGELLLVVVAFAAPIVSLFAFFLKRDVGWLGLYLKRKALEEQHKIDILGKKQQ